MKLTIGTKVPDWWMLDEKPNYPTIEQWWDGIDWVQFNTPEFGDKCVNMNLVQEAICYADIGAHSVAETFQMESIYKFINYNVDKIMGGFQNEFSNIVEMMSCFPC